METRKCKRCGEVKPEDQFKFNKTLGTIGNICKDCRRKRDAEQRATNPEKFRDARRKWNEAHPGRQRELSRARDRRLRKAVIDAYGGKCACCGETEFAFLVIDHINGGGTEHRRAVHGKVYSELRRRGFPPGYRVLCWNCNWAYRLYGNCPHQPGFRREVPMAERVAQIRSR